MTDRSCAESRAAGLIDDADCPVALGIAIAFLAKAATAPHDCAEIADKLAQAKASVFFKPEQIWDILSFLDRLYDELQDRRTAFALEILAQDLDHFGISEDDIARAISDLLPDLHKACLRTYVASDGAGEAGGRAEECDIESAHPKKANGVTVTGGT